MTVSVKSRVEPAETTIIPGFSASSPSKPTGLATLLDKLAAYNRQHSTLAEVFVQSVLEGLGLVDGRDFTRQHRS